MQIAVIEEKPRELRPRIRWRVVRKVDVSRRGPKQLVVEIGKGLVLRLSSFLNIHSIERDIADPVHTVTIAKIKLAGEKLKNGRLAGAIWTNKNVVTVLKFASKPRAKRHLVRVKFNS